MTIWKDCIKEPSEIGKKVLCHKQGDFFVAVRFENYYVPMPFADHYFSKRLAFPDQWCEIDFPKPYTGLIQVAPEGDVKALIPMSEVKLKFPKIYWELAKAMIKSLGTIPKPDGMKDVS